MKEEELEQYQMGHNIHTPLNIIRGISEIIRETPDDTQLVIDGMMKIQDAVTELSEYLDGCMVYLHEHNMVPPDSAIQKLCVSDQDENRLGLAELSFDFSDLHILVAEDQPVNASIIRHFLEGKGCQVDCVSDGRAVVDMFMKYPKRYQMILMDIQMPKQDGYQATREIRNLPIPEASAIPIVAMSGNAAWEDDGRSIQAGMNGYLAKPIKPKLFFETINSILSVNN